MKGNKIDDLFKDGLGSHKISAPSAAWDKIEAQLPNQSKKGIYFWISIAASIILVFTFGWMMMDKSGSETILNPNLTADNTQIEKPQDTPVKQTPTTAQPELITPQEQAPQKLVAQTKPVAESNKEDNTIISIKPSTTVTTQVVASTTEEPVELTLKREFKEIQLIKAHERLMPKFYVADKLAEKNFLIDISMDMESYIKSHQVVAELPAKKKRFSLLNGLVSVAKGVNSGKLALSEMRKSKNDFFNNDLKYGSSEGEEGEDEDLDKDDLNEK